MEIPEDLYYTREHVWLKVSGSRGKIGITDYAQLELGEIVFLNLPEENAPIEQDEVFYEKADVTLDRLMQLEAKAESDISALKNMLSKS